MDVMVRHAAQFRWVGRLLVVGGALVVAYLVLTLGDGSAHADEGRPAGLLSGVVADVTDADAPVTDVVDTVTDVVETAAHGADPVDVRTAAAETMTGEPDTATDRPAEASDGAPATPAVATAVARVASQVSGATPKADALPEAVRSAASALHANLEVGAAVVRVVDGSVDVVAEVPAALGATGAGGAVPAIIDGVVGAVRPLPVVGVIADDLGGVADCVTACLARLVEQPETIRITPPRGEDAAWEPSAGATATGQLPLAEPVGTSAVRVIATLVIAVPGAGATATSPRCTAPPGGAIDHGGRRPGAVARAADQRRPSRPEPLAPAGPNVAVAASNSAGAGTGHAGPDAVACPILVAPRRTGGVALTGGAPVAGRFPGTGLLPG